MTRKLFGTDGVRGLANSEPITAETALKLALAAGAHFTRGDHRHRVIIGKDTRLSGYMLETALTSGFLSMGMHVMLLGPLPTPAVGLLTRSMRADLGVMISASHNPYEDNGIKFFGPDGFKLSDDIEAQISAQTDQAKRNALFKEAFTLLRDDYGYMPLHQQPLSWGVKSSIQLAQRPDDVLDLRNVVMP